MSSQKDTGYKFMQTLDPKIWRKLQRLAKSRRITVQEYLRAIVIPRFLGLDGSPDMVPPEHKEWEKT